MSLVVLTNIPTPYRTAFFDALAEAAAYREVQQLTEVVSTVCVSRVLERKRERKSDGQEARKGR